MNIQLLHTPTYWVTRMALLSIESKVEICDFYISELESNKCVILMSNVGPDVGEIHNFVCSTKSAKQV